MSYQEKFVDPSLPEIVKEPGDNGGVLFRYGGFRVLTLKPAGGHHEIVLHGSLPASGTGLEVGEDGYAVVKKA